MTKDKAISVIWDYMHMGHELKKADVIFVLGSGDTRTAHHAAKLFNDEWAPYLAISGDGTQHENSLLREPEDNRKEADVFADIARDHGVPDDALIIEDTANNTQENFERTLPLLQKRGIGLNTAIVVQKSYMERRTFAAGKVFWPDVELILTSPPGTFEEYIDGLDPDPTINTMVGDLQRIKEYPKRGFQIEQDIPKEVWDAFEHLVSLGYTERLIRESV